jgi:hypothetical protein
MSSWRKNKLWKEQKRFIISTAVIGLFLPILLLLLSILIYLTLGIFRYFILPPLFLMYVVIESVETGNTFWQTLRDYCTFVPFDYVEKESLLERTFNATYALIIINVLIHYGIELLARRPDRWRLHILLAYRIIFIP